MPFRRINHQEISPRERLVVSVKDANVPSRLIVVASKKPSLSAGDHPLAVFGESVFDTHPRFF